MDFDEYEQWLRRLVEDGRLSVTDCDDLLEQRRVFNSKRGEFARAYPGLVVGVVGGEVVVYDTVRDLLGKSAHLDHQIYYEEIPEASTATPPVAAPLLYTVS